MGLTELAAGLSKPLSLKPTKIPRDLILVIDTREQQLLFQHTTNLEFIVDTVRKGDYTIKGFENKFAIERKKQSDLWTYCTSEMEKKTRRKMEEFEEIVRAGGFVGLVIEASESDLLTGYGWARNYKPETVRQALASFEAKYGVNIYYNRDRAAIERWILDRAVKFWWKQREV